MVSTRFLMICKENAIAISKAEKATSFKGIPGSQESQSRVVFLPDLPRGPVAEESIYILATKQIFRRYQSFARKAYRNRATKAKFTRSFIECKKLRYLLELFSSLLPQKKARRIVRRLMGMQTKLGRFNDYCVQTQFLVNHLKNSSSLSSVRQPLSAD